MHYVGNMFYAGVNLQVVKEKMDDCCKFMKKHEHYSLVIMLVGRRVVLILINGETEAGDQFIKIVEEEKNPRQVFLM
jgi:hypothetical protein